MKTAQGAPTTVLRSRFPAGESVRSELLGKTPGDFKTRFDFRSIYATLL